MSVHITQLLKNNSEYGGLNPAYATFTSTGGVSMILSNTPGDIKIESATIGRVVDMGITDTLNMGAVMAPAAADTMSEHLSKLNLTPNDYDLILTGDLGLYGKKIFTGLMAKQYNIEIGDNYNDCGVMLYDLKKQKVYAGGSGPACSALVLNSYVIPKMKAKQYKRVLLLATGAIFSPTFVFQKLSIPAICHAISLEVVK